MRHHVHGFLRHPHVPDVDYSCGISTDCENVLIVRTELPNTKTLLGIFVGHDELFLRLAEVPDFKVAVICSRDEEVASVSFMPAEICVVDPSVTVGLLVNMHGTCALINIPDAHLVKGCCDQEALLILVPV